MLPRDSSGNRLQPTYASWAVFEVARGKLADLPRFAKEKREAAYWAQRDVVTR